MEIEIDIIMGDYLLFNYIKPLKLNMSIVHFKQIGILLRNVDLLRDNI